MLTIERSDILLPIPPLPVVFMPAEANKVFVGLNFDLKCGDPYFFLSFCVSLPL